MMCHCIPLPISQCIHPNRLYIYIYVGGSINGDYPIMTYFPIKMDDLEIPPWNGKPPLSLYKLSHFYYSTIYIYIYIYIYHYKLFIYIYIYIPFISPLSPCPWSYPVPLTLIIPQLADPGETFNVCVMHGLLEIYMYTVNIYIYIHTHTTTLPTCLTHPWVFFFSHNSLTIMLSKKQKILEFFSFFKVKTKKKQKNLGKTKKNKHEPDQTFSGQFCFFGFLVFEVFFHFANGAFQKSLQILFFVGFLEIFCFFGFSPWILSQRVVKYFFCFQLVLIVCTATTHKTS